LFVLTYAQVLQRSLKIATALLLIDGLVGVVLSTIIYPVELFGDMLLLETALLFLFAGIVDYGSSSGFIQFRKAVFSSKETFSPDKRKEAERRAVALVGSGAILLGVLILLAALRG
jgi:hypothetical protein